MLYSKVAFSTLFLGANVAFLAAAELQARSTDQGSNETPDFFSPSAPTKLAPLTGDEDFDFGLYAALDLVRGGGSEANDILAAASYIKPRNMESYANTFWALANQTLAQVESISAAGSNDKSTRITARDSYLAAATYFQMADFYLHGKPSDPRLKQLWKSQTEAFGKGIARLTSVTAQPFSIPTKYNFTIPGFYYRIDSRRRPTILITTGYDGPQETFLSWLGPLIFDHGWNLVTYEGPGQPTVIHSQGIGFRPDWEVVMSPVIDWMEKQPTIDMDHLTSVGMSLGGYLAARGAAFDKRVKAQVLNGGIFSVYDAFTANFGELKEYLGKNNTLFDELVNKYVLKNPNASTGAVWGVEQGLYTFDTRSPADWLLQTKAYTVAKWIDKVHIPTWVVNATKDAFFPGQSAELVAALQKNHAPATLQTMAGVAGLHDQVGASLALNRKMWAWINHVWPNCPSF